MLNFERENTKKVKVVRDRTG